MQSRGDKVRYMLLNVRPAFPQLIDLLARIDGAQTHSIQAHAADDFAAGRDFLIDGDMETTVFSKNYRIRSNYRGVVKLWHVDNE